MVLFGIASGGGVFGIANDDLDLVAGFEFVNDVLEDAPSGAADNIACPEKLHSFKFLVQSSKFQVSLGRYAA